MADGRIELGALTSRLAEALDDLALAVENYRIRELGDDKATRAMEVTEQAIRKARQESRN